MRNVTGATVFRQHGASVFTSKSAELNLVAAEPMSLMERGRRFHRDARDRVFVSLEPA